MTDILKEIEIIEQNKFMTKKNKMTKTKFDNSTDGTLMTPDQHKEMGN